jgi:hypothetical protein
LGFQVVFREVLKEPINEEDEAVFADCAYQLNALLCR